MAKTPIKFKRVAAQFEEVSRRRGPCDDNSSSSSGSEHSPSPSPEIDSSGKDLCRLVNSFIEKGDHWVGSLSSTDDDRDIHENIEVIRKPDGNEEEEENELGGGDGSSSKDKDRKEVLLRLLDDGDSSVTESLRVEVETGWRILGAGGGVDIQRRLMSYLRDRGYDAGLCKSRWEKSSGYPSGDYDYIDVNHLPNNTRYIIQPNLSNEFQVARPTPHYNRLLNTLPGILISRPEMLERIIKLMNRAVKDSLKKANMPVPPWRKNGYMMAKWFGRYKRTTNAVGFNKVGAGEGMMKRAVGFQAPSHDNNKVDVGVVDYDYYDYCRDEVSVGLGFTTHCCFQRNVIDDGAVGL